MSEEKSNTAEIFRRVLNRHGYGFQYRVMDEAKKLYERGQSRWIFEVSEFPVAVRQKDARIDFILRHADKAVYLIAECKRVNPALANWCFARAPYVRRNRESGKLFFSHAMIDGNANLAVGISEETSDQIYHLPFDIPSGEKGDAQGGSRDAIERAAEQVLLGLNGMIEFMSENKLLVNAQQKRWYVPVIFTTANLFTTDINLAVASLDKGDYEKGSVQLTNRPWVWLQYHQSPSLRHSSPKFDHTHAVLDPHRRPAPTLGVILEREYARSIAIVSPSGIDSFLGRDFWLTSTDAE